MPPQPQFTAPRNFLAFKNQKDPGQYKSTQNIFTYCN